MPFVKGQSGNPGGMQRDRDFTNALRKVLFEPADAKFALSKKSRKIDIIAIQLVKKAVSGDVRAIKEVCDRVEGKAIQAIQHSGAIATTHEEAILALEADGSEGT